MKNNRDEGQALVVLLVFIAVAITVITGAVAVTLINSQGASKYFSGEQTLFIAETGAEEGIIRLLRDPAYSGGTLPVANGQAVITVTSGPPNVDLTSEGVLTTFRRKVRVRGTYGDTFTVTNWEEID